MDFGSSREIVLDIYQSRYVVININQYDNETRELIVHITDKGKGFTIPEDVKVLLKYDKPDGHDVVNDCEIIDDNSVRIEFTDQMTICAGQAKAQLMLINYTTGQVLHTMQFIVNIKESVVTDETTSSDEFGVLANMLINCNDTVEEIKAIKKEMEEMFATVSNEKYTEDSMPPMDQREGDYWTRLL